MDRNTYLAGRWQLEGGTWLVIPSDKPCLYRVEETGALGTSFGVIIDTQSSPGGNIFVTIAGMGITYGLYYDFEGAMNGIGYLNKKPRAQVSIRWIGPLSP
jgi:hypothetical protein